MTLAKRPLSDSNSTAAMTTFARRARGRFPILPAPGWQKPEAPDIHIRNLNANHGRLKKWMWHFHDATMKNLPGYLNVRPGTQCVFSDGYSEAAGRLGPQSDAEPSMRGRNAPDGHGIPLKRCIMFPDGH